MELIHLWFLLMLLIKLFGRPKDFQLIEFLLKTQLLLFLAVVLVQKTAHARGAVREPRGWVKSAVCVLGDTFFVPTIC